MLAVTGAAVVPVSLVEQMRDDLGFDTVITAYGLTEGCGFATMCRRTDDATTIATTTIADSLEEGEPRAARNDALALAGNLVLNAGWSGVFFRSRARRLSTLWAGALAASSADLVRRAHRRSPTRGLLLAPYPVWCAFATVLTGEIARLNRS